MEKLALFLDGTRGFRYVRGDYRIEVWLATTEALPLIVSSINNRRYVISSGGLIYEVKDVGRAYRYILRIFKQMNETSSEDLQLAGNR